MPDLILRCLHRLALLLVRPGTGRHRTGHPTPEPPPPARVVVPHPTPPRTCLPPPVIRPLDADAHALVRPYLLAHERRRAERQPARQRPVHLRRTLLLVPSGIELRQFRPHPLGTTP